MGIWLDFMLPLAENRRRRIAKTRQAEARLRRIVNKYGVPPPAARNLQTAIVQGTMLYAAELACSGQKGVEREYQWAINRMGRSTLGAFRSTPQGIVAGESGLTPARALLNRRQARLAQRLCARPRDGGGPEILARERSALATRLRAAAALRRGETAESQAWGTGSQFSGRVIVEERAGALQTTSEWRRRDTIWADGSRIESGEVGVACV